VIFIAIVSSQMQVFCNQNATMGIFRALSHLKIKYLKIITKILKFRKKHISCSFQTLFNSNRTNICSSQRVGCALNTPKMHMRPALGPDPRAAYTALPKTPSCSLLLPISGPCGPYSAGPMQCNSAILNFGQNDTFRPP